MLNFRRLNYTHDIDEVVNLIKCNLDPTYSREILKWKHCENVFGESVSMVAIENFRIVAVVFYMRYNFSNNAGEIIKTLRPVDLCTNISHRGQGIFKKLLRKCREMVNDYDFLLSTPNQLSQPEFLKLDWNTVPNNYFFKIGVIFPLTFKNIPAIKDAKHANVWDNHTYKEGYTTGQSAKFNNWRYKDDDYKIKVIYINQTPSYIIYRVSRIKKIKCIILCDYVGDLKLITQALKAVCRFEKLFVVYFLSNKDTSEINFLLQRNVKEANILYKENTRKYNDDLIYSLGDIEARL